MKTYNPSPSDAYRTCEKIRLSVYFHDQTVKGVSCANVPCSVITNPKHPGGPCVTSHLTGKRYYVDGEKELDLYANLIALDKHGRQKGKYNYAQCAQYKTHMSRVMNRAKMVMRYEIESGMIQFSSDSEALRPNQGQARAPTVVDTRSAAPAVEPQLNRQVGEQYTPAPAVTPRRNISTPPGQTTDKVDRLALQVGNLVLGIGDLAEAVKPIAHQVVRNTADIAALQSSDAETKKSLAEVRERLANLEGSSVGQTTSLVPPPAIQPLPAISGDADVVDMIPTQPRAERASASNPAEQSSVAFVKGQKVGYKHHNGSTESATIVDLHNDSSNPDDPYFTLRMSDGREKQTVKGHLVSITETAPPMSNAGFKTPQRRFENVNGEYFFSIGVTDKKKVRSQTERKTYSERKVARKSTLFGSRTRRSSIARVHIKQPSITRAHRADKVGNLRAVNPAALFPGTPEQHSRSGTPSKPTPLPFNVFN